MQLITASRMPLSPPEWPEQCAVGFDHFLYLSEKWVLCVSEMVTAMHQECCEIFEAEEEIWICRLELVAMRCAYVPAGIDFCDRWQQGSFQRLKPELLQIRIYSRSPA